MKFCQLKYFLLTLTMAHLSISLKAQNFAPLNANWHFQTWCMGFGTPCGFLKVETVRDTTINGLYCTIVINSGPFISVPNAEIILHEDNNQIFFFENNQFRLLFDFNLVTGDTLTFYVPYNARHYDIVCSAPPDTSLPAQLVIDSTFIINASGQSLKAYYTHPVITNDPLFFTQWDMDTLVEKIGSFKGLFGSSTLICLAGSPGHFRCYEDSVVFYKTVNEDCDFLFTNVPEKADIFNLKIFPNPISNGQVTLMSDLPLPENLTMTLSDLSGRIIFDKISLFTRAVNEVQFELPNLAAGIYLLKVDQISARVSLLKN